MKKIKSKSTLIGALLGTLILTGCQGLSRPVARNSNVDTSGDSSLIASSSDFFSSSSVEYATVRKAENGITIIKESNEAFPREGFSFKIDSLDQEFYIKGNDLYAKSTGENADRRCLSSVVSLYLVDVNKDGHLDFIYTSTSNRSKKSAGIWLGIYDYKNYGELYYLDDPNQFDYRLELINSQFVVSQFTTDNFESENVLELGRLVGKGIIDYSGANITTKWQNFLNIDSFDFNVTLAGKDRTPVEVETTYEAGTYVVKNASVDDAYCITTNIKRNSGNYDDLTEDLPVGYRLNGYYRLVQATANNHQDNVIINLDSYNLKYNASKAAVVEVCVSSFIYKIVFQIETYEYAINHKTLIQELGWNFAKTDIVKFYTEYIPGSGDGRYSEESYPFVYVSVAGNEEATQTSYNILEGIVVNIDSALVKKLEYPSTYNFKTSDNKYTLLTHDSFIEYNGNFYLIIYARNYSYAFGLSNGYVRFRDAYKELRVDAYVPGLKSHVVQNATDILFQQRSINTEAQRESLKNNAQYTFNIAGNQFYIIDAKTMIMNSSKFEVVSDADFSSLFPTH